MIRFVPSLALLMLMVVAAEARAQSLGTFRWQLQTFGSVVHLNVTQQGSIYTLHGFEAQCSNPSVPVWGVAVPQTNGTVLLGLTTLTETGRGLHTIATISISNGFNGTWRDNANQSGTFAFNPGNTCPGGPRIPPIFPDPREGDSHLAAARLQLLEDQIAALRAELATLAAGKQ